MSYTYIWKNPTYLPLYCNARYRHKYFYFYFWGRKFLFLFHFISDMFLFILTLNPTVRIQMFQWIVAVHRDRNKYFWYSQIFFKRQIRSEFYFLLSFGKRIWINVRDCYMKFNKIFTLILNMQTLLNRFKLWSKFFLSFARNNRVLRKI